MSMQINPSNYDNQHLELNSIHDDLPLIIPRSLSSTSLDYQYKRRSMSNIPDYPIPKTKSMMMDCNEYTIKEFPIHLLQRILSFTDTFTIKNTYLNKHWTRVMNTMLYKQPIIIATKTFYLLMNTLMNGSLYPYHEYIQSLCIDTVHADTILIGDLDLIFKKLTQLHQIYLSGHTITNRLLQSLGDTIPKLTHISLTECIITDQIFLEFIMCCSSLKCIELINSGVSSITIMNIIKLCKNIDDLYIDGIQSNQYPSITFSNHNFNCPLTKLSILNSSLNDLHYRFIFWNCCKMMKILLMNLSIDDDIILYMIKYCQQLNYFTITNCECITDISLLSIGYHSKSLEYLYLNQLQNITLYGIQQMCIHIQKLKKLVLDCNQFLDTWLTLYHIEPIFLGFDIVVRDDDIKLLGQHSNGNFDFKLPIVRNVATQTEQMDPIDTIPNLAEKNSLSLVDHDGKISSMDRLNEFNGQRMRRHTTDSTNFSINIPKASFSRLPRPKSSHSIQQNSQRSLAHMKEPLIVQKPESLKVSVKVNDTIANRPTKLRLPSALPSFVKESEHVSLGTKSGRVRVYRKFQ
ncbi:hypothetical protein HDV02_000072 [Globomyces sp. JEL0801]|nr:hypothetical protein HDV02_000072 [Globomyces sp. JEL0801]